PSPTRSCVKNTGPPSSILIAAPSASQVGAETSSPTPERVISRRRLPTGTGLASRPGKGTEVEISSSIIKTASSFGLQASNQRSWKLEAEAQSRENATFNRRARRDRRE